jgi:riboflavin kinase/FMN adenylyltransferase
MEIWNPRDLSPAGTKLSLAIGMFDGVHLGHQQVIRQAVVDAEQHEGRAVAVTFDRHPNAVVAPERVPPLIYSRASKVRALASMGLDATLILPFTTELSRQPPETFIRGLAAQLGTIYSVCVGDSFTFGHKRSGNVCLLRQLGSALEFLVHGIGAVSLDGEAVSSTRIREQVRLGDLNRASQMLGREYALSGPVIHGDALGRTLGFPTANLDISGMQVPPAGVYAAHAYVNGQRHRAVVNIGCRPTMRHSTPELRVEAHLLDFDGDLYGLDLDLTFAGKLREEQQFPSTNALREQISRDIASARARF